MKNVGLFFSLLTVGLITGGLGSAYYSWHQATRLPSWYTGQTSVATSLPPEDLEAARARVIQSLTVTETGSVEGELSGEEFNQLVLGTIAEDPNNRRILENVRGFNTTIEDGRLRSGVVVSLADVPIDQLGEGERVILERAIALFPALADQTVYIGLEGQPILEDGYLKLGDGTTLTVGDLKIPLRDIAEQLGISYQELEQGINLQLQLSGIDIDTLELTGDRMVIRGLMGG